jgi:hypothetical protein
VNALMLVRRAPRAIGHSFRILPLLSGKLSGKLRDVLRKDSAIRSRRLRRKHLKKTGRNTSRTCDEARTPAFLAGGCGVLFWIPSATWESAFAPSQLRRDNFWRAGVQTASERQRASHTKGATTVSSWCTFILSFGHAKEDSKDTFRIVHR